MLTKARSPIIRAVDEGHIAEWVDEPPRVTVINAMRRVREVAGLCKKCKTQFPCPSILEARIQHNKEVRAA